MSSFTSFGRVILGALVASLAIGCRGEAEKSQPPLPKVTVSHPVAQKLVDEDDFNGWLQATQSVEVRSRVRGHIWKIHFRDGDMVQKDQLLFELDPRPFQAAVSETEAEVRALDAQRLAADKDVIRYETLVKSNAAPVQELDKTRADALSYAARVAAKKEEATKFKLDLEFSRIVAPITGRIGRALLTEGNLVQAGGSDPVLTTIVAIDPIYVYFTIDERSLQRYQKMRRPGDDVKRPESIRELKIPFRFGLDVDQGFPHQGTLDFADNKIDQTTGTAEVRGVVANDKRLFVPGSRARVRVPVSEPYDAILVPDTTVLSDQEKRYLLVLGKDNVVLRRDVVLGKLLDDGQRVILPAAGEGEGVKAGDWVITLGLQRARIDYSVEPVDSQGQPIGKPSS
jgi:RND family efflux transporter MFP subunit